jgi:hypothetical protein
MSDLVPLSAVVAIFIIAIAGLAYSASLRGGPRLTWRSAGIWIALPCAATAAVLSLSDNASISTSLSVGGVLLSFVFGFAGNQLTTERIGRKINVGLVIASKSAFHQEVRRTLYDDLRQIGCHIRDDGAEPSFGRENLIGFSGIFRSLSQYKPDYVVFWAPGQAAADNDDITAGVEDLYRRGGLSIFLETGPSRADLAGKFALIRHDAVRASELIVEATLKICKPDTEILVVLGPSFSAPGVRRRAVIEKAFPESAGCRHVHLDTWLPDEAITRIGSSLAQGPRPNVVLCPNDSITLALIDEMYHRRELAPIRHAKIVGCDGLLRAYASIAEPTSPFVLTVAIPPGEFGACAARIIRDLARVSAFPRRRRNALAVDKVMEMDDRNVIDAARARRRLYETD